MAEGPLTGIKVVEVASLVAAPYAAKILADYGADVVKVESPQGDQLRSLDADFFDNLNTSKRGIVLDLDTAEGRAELAALVAQADVVIEDLAPGRLAELIGDPWQGNAKLVVGSVTPYGQDGPRAGWKGGDLVGWAAGGMAFISGLPDQEPLAPAGMQAWHLAGLQTATAALYAVFHALRTGEGQRVDTSVQEAVCTILEGAVTDWQFLQHDRGRMGTLHPAGHGTGMQRLADGTWLFCSTMPRPNHWTKTRELLGNPEWMQDPRWDDLGVRRAHWEEIDAKASEVFSKLRREDIYHQMLDAGVPVGVVSTMQDVVESEQLNARDFFVEVEGRTYLGAPWKMSATPFSISRPSPQLGQHDAEILGGRW
jgi:crotonobetainyl-CoA:carnitine CoA-transferase CaiB-like acyl-CoA transferase